MIGQREAIFWLKIILRKTWCSCEWCKIDVWVAEWLTFPSQWPSLPLKFLGHVMSNLVRIHIQSFPWRKNIHFHFLLFFSVYFFFTFKYIINDVKLMNALRKSPQMLLCLGICGEARMTFTWMITVVQFWVSRSTKHDMVCENIELICNHQSSEGIFRTGSHQHEMHK